MDYADKKPVAITILHNMVTLILWDVLQHSKPNLSSQGPRRDKTCLGVSNKARLKTVS